MKNLKLLILGFAALGLVIELSIWGLDGTKAIITHPFAEGGMGLIMILGFVAPLVMGIMGMTKPPFVAWQAIVSLAGFAAIAIKLKIWDGIIHVMDAPLKGKLMLVAIVGGVIVSAMAAAKPENKG